MSRRRRPRLIERGEENRYVGYPAAMPNINTRGYADPVNAFTATTPPRGVQNPVSASYRGTNSAYPGATGTGSAFNAGTDSYGAYNATRGGLVNAYDATSGRAYDATNANGAYNVTANANGPINEAYSSQLRTAANGIYDEYGTAADAVDGDVY